ncbi:MAG: HPr kinase/phosphorylase [Rhodocyclaceae bacterium]|nr:HPr kinase/phosphorylase [Rhodocyclaceae bacterium]MBX3668734.1 HPr kinase/phosphorylase [Rhodocyclaceae bacterium]
MRQVAVGKLYDHFRERLEFEWLCGERTAAIVARHEGVFPADLIGHLSYIHADRVQVLGAEEVRWVAQEAGTTAGAYLEPVFSARPPAFIVADGCPPPQTVRDYAAANGVAVIVTPKSAAMVIEHIRNYLMRELAQTMSAHGVFMDVLGLGALITGDSGVGKSELALELISRGHGLVADDIVEIALVGPDLLEGRCPQLLRDFLEVRGLGVLNVRTVFGETACRRKMKLQLVVYLQKPTPGIPEATRLPLEHETVNMLGVQIRKVIIPVAAGRNLAVLVETAVRTTILKMRGIDSTLEFIDRQQQALNADDLD